MHLDPAIPSIVAALAVVLAIGMVLRWLRQPHVLGYVLAGIALGPHGAGLVNDLDAIARLGSFGVVLLLFFIGMEVSPRRLVSTWRVSVLGTTLQILGSVAAVGVIGAWLDWTLARIVLLGFVISLSSTAVVIKVIENWQETNTPVADDAIGVLLVQDLAIVPMVIVVGLLSDDPSATGHWPAQIVGAVALAGLIAWLVRNEQIHLPLGRYLERDNELQVFASLTICFGLGLATGLAGLSSALGAFVAGMIIGAARETHWVHESLEPFRVVFLALFFASVGMLLDVPFVIERLGVVVALLVLALVGNTLLNAAILRVLGYGWREGLFVGTLLGPIGEFSFVLAAVGLQANVINEAGHQLAIAVIALCLIVSPAWMAWGRRIRRSAAPAAPA